LLPRRRARHALAHRLRRRGRRRGADLAEPPRARRRLHADAHGAAAGDVAAWPAMLSLAFLLSSLTFWTQYANHFGRPWPAAGNRPTAPVFAVVAPDPIFRGAEIQNLYVAHALGVASILLQAGFIAGIVLLALRR